jgi:murein DD-endopeptidase MepM/ murein hydrolase activator NlpD
VARHRSAGDYRPSPEVTLALKRVRTHSGGSHRFPSPPPALRGRVVLAAVAAGAFVAAGSQLNQMQLDQMQPASDETPDGGLQTTADGAVHLAFSVGGDSAPQELLRPRVLAFVRDDPSQLKNLTKGERIGAQRAASQAAEVARAARAARAAQQARTTQQAPRPQPAQPAAPVAQAPRAMYVIPAVGRLTSGYGARWGTMHWGIDIANKIGTPIKAAATGVVVESGPASGFGLWVRIRHADGNITVYGHIDRSLVRAGQQVTAGQQIATMGNRGDSTGPHLHFEVWTAGGSKINPLTWLRSKGVKI